jgi:hypothetical protein
MPTWAVIVVAFWGAPPAVGGGAADVVILRDGKAVLGQVVEPSPPGKVRVVVRRAWLEANLPDRAAAWVKSSADSSRRAGGERRARLEAWRRERRADAGDPVLRWIEGELARPEAADATDRPLLVVAIDARQVARVRRADPDAARMLRQAWRAKLDDPEATPRGALRERLEGRGFALGAVDPAPIDELVAPVSEPDDVWRLRRAATEVKAEPALRFVRYGDLVLPENAGEGAGAMAGVGAMARAARSALGGLTGEAAPPAEDAMTPFLRELEARGRAGAVLTVLVLDEGMTGVRVESALLVRVRPGRWVPAVSRLGQGRPGALPAAEGVAVAADPQVQAVFRLAEGLGLGAITPEVRQRSVDIGAATRSALGVAQSALGREIESLALPLGR